MFSPRLVIVAAAALIPIGASAAPPIITNTTQFTTGGLTVLAPLDGNREVAGPKTTAVTISAPAGTFTPLKPLTIDVVVFMHDAAGVVQSLQVFGNILGSTITSSADGSLSSTQIDFSMSASPTNLGSNLNIAINTAKALVNAGITVSGGGASTGFGIGIVVNDSTVDGADGAETLLNLTDEALDTVIDADNIGPVLTQVFRNSAACAQRMIFVFDENISTSTFTNLTNIDFEFSSSADGPFTAFSAAAFPGNPVLIASGNNRTLSFPIVIEQNNLAPGVGDFVRVALTGSPRENADLTDLALNPADAQPAIEVLVFNSQPCPGELNGDGVVNGADLANLLSVWGASPSRADFNSDCMVNAADLAILLANWGTCP
jgi:hypothetical protein